jgi:tripartite-type tricarboxylate transporter receptor subunit TctC
MYFIRRRKLSFALVLFGLFSFSGPVFSQAPFYQGKTLTIMNASAPGGGGDMRVKAMLPYLRKYIPGQPTIMAEFMVGGGGRKLANHMYRSVRADGLTLGYTTGGVVTYGVMGETGVNYDIDKFIYLGTPETAFNYMFVTRKAAGIDSIAKLRTTPGLRVGAHSVGHTFYVLGRLFAYGLRLKEPKFVVGYSGPEVDVALTGGEVDGRASNADTVVQRTPEFFEKNLVDFHAILNVPKANRHVRFGYLPEIDALVKSEDDRKLVELYRSLRLIGSPFVLPPGTPPERVQILRAAFHKTFTDPGFQKDYKKLVGDEPSPLGADEVQRALEALPRERSVIELFKRLTSADPLPAQ